MSDQASAVSPKVILLLTRPMAFEQSVFLPGDVVVVAKVKGPLAFSNPYTANVNTVPGLWLKRTCKLDDVPQFGESSSSDKHLRFWQVPSKRARYVSNPDVPQVLKVTVVEPLGTTKWKRRTGDSYGKPQNGSSDANKAAFRVSLLIDDPEKTCSAREHASSTLGASARALSRISKVASGSTISAGSNTTIINWTGNKENSAMTRTGAEQSVKPDPRHLRLLQPAEESNTRRERFALVHGPHDSMEYSPGGTVATKNSAFQEGLLCPQEGTDPNDLELEEEMNP